ncbi:hypothetical protein PSTG_10681 [Puccinia striiformis f. sp. tritici PST-78]|uniref:Uncharacterized protein n=1 Tax=Puccinia striiformis f. sp. tritici PST-78 TaxID=1165861 RepID=A0A0L0V9N5_9BASI|nr:hypothetical protein PSTG_10681 [Puccinia striiformis f. sp. tritici PST-78]
MAIDYLVSLGPRNNSNNNIRFKLIQTIYDYKLLDKQTQYRANHWDLIYNRLLHQRNRSSFTFLNQARRNQALTTKKKEIEIGSAKYHKLKKTHPAPINTYLAGNEETIILVLNTNDYINHLRLIDQRLRSPSNNRDSAKKLWKVIKDWFASAQSSNQAQMFNNFSYFPCKEDPVESSVTDIRVLIQNMVDVGMDLPSEILAYLILFKLPSNFQSLKRQMQEG